VPGILADDASVNLPGALSPAFTVNGTAYSNVRMNSNGWLMLYGATAPGGTGNYTVLSVGQANAGVTIAPFGCDMNGTGHFAYYQTIGNEHIFEWKDFQRFGIADVVNVQVRLNYVTGNISFVYGTCTPAASAIRQPQVGWKTNGSVAANWTTDVNSLQLNDVGSGAGCAWTDAVASNANTSTMYFNSASPSLAPASGLTITWTKPATGQAPVRTYGAVTSIGLSSADISWTAPSGATSYEVQYRVVGSCSWTNHPSNPFATTSATISGLAGSTSYQVRVRAIGAGGTSFWSHVPGPTAGAGVNGYTSSGTFTTLCTSASVPYTQNFESVAAGSIPGCTQVVQNGTGNLWNTVNAPGAGFTSRTLQYTYNSTNPANVWYFIRALNLTGGTSYRLTYNYGNNSTTYVEQLQVAYGNAPTNAAMTTTLVDHTVINQNAIQSNTIDFTPASTGDYYIGFRAHSIANQFNLYLDNIVVDLTPTCQSPTSVTGTTTSSTTANISWPAPGVPPAFGYEYVVNTTAGSPSNAANTGTDFAGLSTSVSGLLPNTTYYVHVRSECVNGSVYGAWTNSASFYTGYCVASSVSFSSYMTDVVTTGGVVNISNTTGASGGGYGNYTGQSVAQSQGNSVNFAVTYVADPGLALWVDWNNNLVFETSERMYNSAAYLTADATVNFSFNVPALQPVGNYRMRLVTNYVATSPGACPVGINGETEDYTFTVIPDPTCGVPTGLTAAVTSTTTANISWTAPVIGPATGYYYVVDNSPANPIVVGTFNAGTSTSVSGLTPNTTYYLHVMADCGVNGPSFWATSASFYTGVCIASGTGADSYITNFTTSGGATNINNTTAFSVGGWGQYPAQAVSQYPTGTVNFTATYISDPGFAIYVDWNNDLVFANPAERVYTSNSYNASSVSGSFVVPALQPTGNYTMRITANWSSTNPVECPVGIDGETEDYTFTVVPLPTCFPPTGLSATPVTFTSANISWVAPVLGTPVGYEWAVTTSATPPGSGTAVGAGTTSVAAVTTTANVQNYLHVMTDCGGGGPSVWATYSFYSGYCASTTTSGNEGQSYIGNFTTTSGVTNINNTSTFTAGPPAGYQDFTAFSCSQYADQDIAVQMNAVDGGGGVGIGIWVDWNNDLDFSDLGEFIVGSNAYLSGNVGSVYHIPPGTPVGSYRVRLRVDWNDITPDPCNNIARGETEDYTLNVVPLPSCGAVVYAPTYTTSTDLPLVCTGQTVTFTSAPAAPFAANITYRLDYSAAIGGPYTPLVAAQVSNEFQVLSPSTGFYKIVTLCSGSPVAATFAPVGVSISNPVIATTTPASRCGTGTVTLDATATPALASIGWYAAAAGGVPLFYGTTYTTPSIGATTTYYVQAENIIPTTAIGTNNTTTNATGVTPFTALWENVRTYYLVRKSELLAAGLSASDLTSVAFNVTQLNGDTAMRNFAIRMAHTTAANLNGGFATTVGAFTTVYTNASEPVPAVGLKTFSFGATPFTWNGNDNVILEICHANDVTASCLCYDGSATVEYTATTFNSVYSKYQDNAANCGLDLGTAVLTNNRPNLTFGGAVSLCNSPRVPVVATVGTNPGVTVPGNQLFAPTIALFNPIPLTSSSPTPGATVTYTPASGIYVDAATSALYFGGDDINGVTQYFAPLSTNVYTVTATGVNGCTSTGSFTVTVDASGLPNSACAAVNVNTTNTLTFTNVNTIGAIPGIGVPCGGIANQVWFKTVVPASGEVHVVTKSNGLTLTDLTASNLALYTSTNCSTIVNTACNNNGGPGNFSYAYTQATPGSTVYIRVSGLLAGAVQNGRLKMAVTSGLIWTPTNGDNFALAENWQGGDATAITTPSANQSVIIPAGTTKPKLYGAQSVKTMTINTAAPYYTSTGIDLNANTLSIKGNWNVGPVASAVSTITCNGTVEFSGTAAQSISGRTTFGNLTLNNAAGLTLTNTTGVTCILKPTLGALTTGGFLVLRSTAANNAALIDPTGAGTISGNTSVERKIGPTSGYHYLAAPVSGALVNNTTVGWRDDFTINAAVDNLVFIPGTVYSVLPTVWEYQETVNNPNDAYGYVGATGTTDAITPLKGFACIVPANVTVDLLGPVNNGAITPYGVTLTDNGLNLIGNPYPSPISWNSFRTTNGSALSTSGYKAFVATGGYAGTYGTWNGSTGTAGVTDRIASSQAFIATAINNSTISAANTNRMVAASDVTASFFGYSEVPNLLRMDISGNGFADQAVVYFDNAASDALDMDATNILSTTPGVPNIYTKVGAQTVSINAMGKLDMDKVVPMGVKIQTAGTYNFNVVDMSSFTPSVVAYLEDTQAGTMTNLRTNPSYSVTLPEGDINNRFFIHFHPAVEINAVNETCAGNDGKLVINYPTSNTVSLVVKNANGNVVSTQNNINGVVTINNLVAGNYVAEMTFGIAPNIYTTSDYFTVAGGNAVYANLSASANTVDMNANTTVNFTATAQGATGFNWNFGDGTVITNGPANVAHTFANAGNYNVTFEASNGICNTVATTTVEVTNLTGLTAIANSNLQVVGVGSKVTVRFGNKMEGTGNIEVINMLGEVVAHLDNVAMKGTREIEMSSIAAGQYMVKITNNNQLYTEKVFLSRQ
jgi:hypothetical protein